MSYTYALTNPSARDYVRLLIPDRDPDAVIFQNEEIDTLLAIEGGNPLHGTALALETMASNEAYIQKVMRLGDLHTDGAHVSRELRTRAQTLRERAEKTGQIDVNVLFDWAEWTVNSFTEKEHWERELQRQGLT